MRGFPKVGVPLNNPLLDGIFHEINRPAMGVPPWLWKPPWKNVEVENTASTSPAKQKRRFFSRPVGSLQHMLVRQNLLWRAHALEKQHEFVTIEFAGYIELNLCQALRSDKSSLIHWFQPQIGFVGYYGSRKTNSNLAKLWKHLWVLHVTPQICWIIEHL